MATSLRTRPAREAAEEILRCRSFGHSWEDFNPIDARKPSYGWLFSLRCVRCGTERHDVIDSRGFLNGRRYLYPDDYREAGEGFRTAELGREEFRRELAYRRYGRPKPEPKSNAA